MVQGSNVNAIRYFDTDEKSNHVGVPRVVVLFLFHLWAEIALKDGDVVLYTIKRCTPERPVS